MPLDIAALLKSLTVQEKASLCLGSDFWHTAAVERLGIPEIMVADGPHGLRKQPKEADHVGLSGSVPATCFPTASAMGSSWNVELVHEIGRALGRECQAEEVGVLLGPGINIKRSPLCGRNFEYLSEDPLLSGVLATAMVQGVQSEGVGTSLKHYAVNNQETDRLRVSADVDDRTLREIYLPAFERVVTQAQPWTVMCSYNRVNGTHASQHRWLLTDVLRGEWGFDGVVVSDWGAVHDRVAALRAGLDLEMPPNLGHSDAAIIAAVESGELSAAELDTAAGRVLALVDRAVSGASGGTFDAEAHHQLARTAAQECAVLLKNDGALPLTPVVGSTIAVIGEFARTSRYQGAGSSQVNPTRVDSALDELRAGVPDGVEITFGAGFGIDQTDTDAELATEAVELAGVADVVVAFLGLPASAESEGFDRTDIDLPANQLALLPQLAEANANLVVVLANGSAVAVSGWDQHAKAILECWLSGQAAGGAAADLLLGRANPSGRLAETIPIRLQDNSSYLNFPGGDGHVLYGEGVFVGYRGYDAAGLEVSYPFGHGLSYTSFEYSELEVAVIGSAAAGDLAVSVSCQVRNAGDGGGAEVVQVYVHDVESSIARPVRELRGFAKVFLAAGQSERVEVTLGARDMSFWSVQNDGWALEAGQFEVSVGASSRDLRLRTLIDVDAPPITAPLGRMSTLQEWLSDPEGEKQVRAAFGTDDDGRPNGILAHPETLQVIGNFPMSSLAAFPGIGLDNATLDRLVQGRARPDDQGR